MISRVDIIKKLKDLQDIEDFEHAHSEADRLLLEFIADGEITRNFNKVGKWYA